MRRRPAAAALVEQKYIVTRRIELAAVGGAAPRARTAVKEDDWLGAWRAASLPMKAVPVADIEPAALVRLKRRVKGAKVGQKLISS
jgi:hypothetical protein